MERKDESGGSGLAPGTPPGASPGEMSAAAGAGRENRRADFALTVGLVVYVLLLAVATCGEILEIDSILKWFR